MQRPPLSAFNSRQRDTFRVQRVAYLSFFFVCEKVCANAKFWPGSVNLAAKIRHGLQATGSPRRANSSDCAIAFAVHSRNDSMPSDDNQIRIVVPSQSNRIKKPVCKNEYKEETLKQSRQMAFLAGIPEIIGSRKDEAMALFVSRRDSD